MIDPFAAFHRAVLDFIDSIVEALMPTRRQRRWYVYRVTSGAGWLVADEPKGVQPARAVWMPSHQEAIQTAWSLIKRRV